MRVTCAVSSRRRRKKILRRAKGFWGDRKNHIRQSKDAVMKAMAYATVHRKKRKGDFRRLWITRLGVAAKMCGLSYCHMIAGLRRAGCLLNRKMLADLAVTDPDAFALVAERAKQALLS